MRGAPLPLPKPNWTRGGGRPPSFPFPPLRWKEGGSRLGLGVLVGLPPLGAPLGPAGLPSPPLYTGVGGTPKTQQTIVLVVCGAHLHSYTPRSYRRSA